MSTAVVRIFEHELKVIVAEILRFPDIETGGALWGLWSHADNPTILLATRPGPQAIRHETRFQEDPEAHMQLERALWERCGLQCVGMWHSHHRLGLHELSLGDIDRTRRYAAHSGRDRFCDLLGYYLASDKVGVRPFVYRNARDGHCVATELAVLPGKSPVRRAVHRRTVRGLGDTLIPAPRHALNATWVLEPSRPRVAPALSEDGSAPDHGRPAPLIHAVEALVGEAVPERWLGHVALFTPDPGHAILEVDGTPDAPLLRVLFGWEDRPVVLRWEAVRQAPPPARLVASDEPPPGRRADLRAALEAGLRHLRTHPPDRSAHGLGTPPAVPARDGEVDPS